MAVNIERGFLPLPKIDKAEPIGGIAVNLNLPLEVDQDRIGINLAGIRELCNLGGISEITIIGSTGGETSHTVSEITGHNSDGSPITMGKVTKVIVPPFASNSHDATRSDSGVAERWVQLKIDANIGEIESRVSEKGEGEYSTRNWTRELNSGLKASIRETGTQNLVCRPEPTDKLVYQNYALVAGAFTGATLFTNGEFNSLSYFALAWGIHRGYSLYQAYNDRNHRFALFPGLQFDRAILLNLDSRFTTLVKDLYKNKK